MDGVDSIAATAVSFIRDLHVKKKGSEGIRGMTFDLKSAYRQLAVWDESLRWARLAVFNPHQKSTELYQQYSLPFGARASVIAFIRCARMIQWLALRLEIVNTSYFDDFVVLSRPGTAGNAEKSFACLLDLLGWKYDQSGEKSDTMSTTLKALGVQFDRSNSVAGYILVCDTAKRKRELADKIDEVLRNGALTGPAAASLKGRLGFVEGQLFGRASRKLLHELGQHAIRTPPGGKLSEATQFALRFVGSRIWSRKIAWWNLRPRAYSSCLPMLLLRVIPRLEGWEVSFWMPPERFYHGSAANWVRPSVLQLYLRSRASYWWTGDTSSSCWFQSLERTDCVYACGGLHWQWMKRREYASSKGTARMTLYLQWLTQCPYWKKSVAAFHGMFVCLRRQT